MSVYSLEDFSFGGPTVAAPTAAPAPQGGYDEGYAAGWEDAVARIEADQTRAGERLLETLSTLENRQDEARDQVVAALEPALRDVFDTLLPRAAGRTFLPILVEEMKSVLSAETGGLTVLVAPEEEAPLTALLEQSDLPPARIRIRGEPALGLSQALIRWQDGERRIDLEAVLGALDDALDAFLSDILPSASTEGSIPTKEAIRA